MTDKESKSKEGLYPNKRNQLEEMQEVLKDQIQKGKQSINIIQQELQRLIDDYNKGLAKLELLDELETETSDKA